MEEKSIQDKYAILIDGDNAQASLLPQILAEVSTDGLITIKRIYGDWTTTNMNQWKESLHKYAIQAIQQFRYTTGKNATDNAMIIDAMDLLHSNNVQGFCIVSSDSDYTRLATRIREQGLHVIGVGRQDTPEAFQNACNRFIYNENLEETEKPKKKRKTKKSGDKGKEQETNQMYPDPLPLLMRGFNAAAKEEEWVPLATMGGKLHELDPAFDPRTFGHKRLQLLIKEYRETFVMKKTGGTLNISLAPEVNKD